MSLLSASRLIDGSAVPPLRQRRSPARQRLEVMDAPHRGQLPITSRLSFSSSPHDWAAPTAVSREDLAKEMIGITSRRVAAEWRPGFSRSASSLNGAGEVEADVELHVLPYGLGHVPKVRPRCAAKVQVRDGEAETGAEGLPVPLEVEEVAFLVGRVGREGPGLTFGAFIEHQPHPPIDCRPFLRVGDLGHSPLFLDNRHGLLPDSRRNSQTGWVEGRQAM